MNANILVKTEGLSHEEWLCWRKKGIGGSDVSAILGINKWTSAFELWLDKTNQKNDPVEVNEAMELGIVMEPAIRNHFANVTGKTVMEVKAMLQHPEHPFMLADVDGSDAAKELLDNTYHGGKKEEIILSDKAVTWIDSYIEACADEDSAKAKKQEAANHLKDLLGDNEIAKCADHSISWKTVTTDRFNTKAFKEAEPDLYAKYVKSSTSRRFIVK